MDSHLRLLAGPVGADDCEPRHAELQLWVWVIADDTYRNGRVSRFVLENSKTGEIVGDAECRTPFTCTLTVRGATATYSGGGVVTTQELSEWMP